MSTAPCAGSGLGWPEVLGLAPGYLAQSVHAVLPHLHRLAVLFGVGVSPLPRAVLGPGSKKTYSL